MKIFEIKALDRHKNTKLHVVHAANKEDAMQHVRNDGDSVTIYGIAEVRGPVHYEVDDEWQIECSNCHGWYTWDIPSQSLKCSECGDTLSDITL